MTEILIKIIDSLGWSPEDIVKKKHGTSPEITAKLFVSAITATTSIPEAAKYLNIGEQTLNRIISSKLIPLFGKLTGANNTWKLKLLNNAELKYCSSCNEVFNFSCFTKDSSTYDGLDKKCKSCKSVINSEFYRDNKDSYHKDYIEANRQEYNARNAKRRAAKLKATPTWADQEKIKQIYNTCPAGYHVDHIYPLISDWVCGLHVSENLQHLTAEENMQKGNRTTGGVVKLANTSDLSSDASA